MKKNKYSPRRKLGGFSLSASLTLISLTALENKLRTSGVITEGYNPDSDSYERRFNLGSLSVTKTLRSFASEVPSKPAFSGERQDRTPPRYKVTRPGVTMYFGSPSDLAKRMWQLGDHDGAHVAPREAFIVRDLRKNSYSFLLPERVKVHACRKPGQPSCLPLAA